ncbi:MAG: hypothetical protein EXS59_03015 [Candidatus Taylorbacteria bacterium]|nr:hypothetical protein [Candidatus Taylorbacteria bacterium]
MKIGYLGPGKSSFGFAATEIFFGKQKEAEFISCANHTEICRMAGIGEINYGVVAVENVIDGVVAETIHAIDHFRRSSRLWIFGEVELPIELFLFRKNNDGATLTKIVGHKTALGQCSKRVNAFLGANSGIRQEIVDSNSKAAEEASKDSSAIAISTARAEQEYGLIRLEPNSITNNPNSFTRFWVIGTTEAKPSPKDKTCLLVNLNQDAPGGLCGVLAPFSSRGINLLIIAPIPIHGRKWEYSFLVEFSGSFTDQIMQDAYGDLCESGVAMGGPLLLGSYPAGTTK